MTCLHEALNGCLTREEFYQTMRGVDGNSDCGLMFTDFQEVFPEARTVIIRRHPAAVYHSLVQVGAPIEFSILEGMDFRLRRLKGLHVMYDLVDDSLEDISEYLGLPFDPEKAEIFKNMRICPKVITGNPASLAIWL